MDKRVISAILAIPLLFFFTIMGGYTFKFGVMVLSLIAVYEYVNAYMESKNKSISLILYLGILINSFIVFSKLNIELIFLMIILTTILSMATPIFTKKYNVISSAITVIGLIYIVCFFDFLVFIREKENGNKLIWLVFIIAWASDTFAYYFGRFFGKHKLCPEVSPKKTIEGSIGGIIGSIIGVSVWFIIFKPTNINLFSLIILGIVGGSISQIGDLSASLIKRFVNIKDYGKIMPGHGGVLDRFDSILFIAPVVYYYIEFFIG